MAENSNNTLSESQRQRLFFASAIDNLADPYRTTRWRFVIPSEITKMASINTTNGQDFKTNTDELTLQISGGVKVPKVGVKSDSQWYMGFEKKFATMQDGLAGQMPLDFIYLEDNRAYEAMVGWNQSVLNQGVLVNKAGVSTKHEDSRTANEGTSHIFLGLGQQSNISNGTRQVMRNSTVQLELYDWMYGDTILVVSLINAWPLSVEGVSGLSYNGAKLGIFKATLQYDRFTLYIPSGYREIGKSNS